MSERLWNFGRTGNLALAFALMIAPATGFSATVRVTADFIEVELPNTGASQLFYQWDGLTLSHTGTNLGFGNEWFILPDVGAFGPDYVTSNTPWASNILPIHSGSTFLQGFDPIYLGSWTDYDGEVSPTGVGDNVPGPGDLFVWVRVGGPLSLNLQDFGIDETGRGIFIGTQRSVPEPAAPLLAIFALLFGMIRRRR